MGRAKSAAKAMTPNDTRRAGVPSKNAARASRDASDPASPAEAEATLAKLASALFPAGEGDFAQLTWNGTPVMAPPARPGGNSEQAHVEKQLRAADLRYRTLVEQIPAVTFLAVLGEGENEIYVSPYIEALLGFTQQEWLENPFLWYSQLHPDDRALWHDEFSRGIRTGGPFRAECRFLARDGRVVWVRGEARLVKDEMGRPLFLQGVAFDVTESKSTHSRQLLEAVRSTEQRYRDLVEYIDAVFWEAQTDTGVFTFVSRGVENILGCSRDQWISDPAFWLTRVHPDDRNFVSQIWSQALGSEGEHEFEFRAITMDKREVWLHMRAQARSIDTPERRLFGVMLDVTERKRGDEERALLLTATEEARRSAEAANRAKDEFLATMSHELKTPLNALLGYSQLLRAKQLPEELMDRALESIERNAKAQATLVDDLLDVSRIITGKLHLEVRPVLVSEVVDAALDTVRLAADAKRITLHLNIDRSGLLVSGDASRLQQVVWNLLSNAVKFTPEGGKVEVLLDRIEDHARIRVSDNGQGLSRDFLPHVFERFRQGDSSVTRKHGGLGLGLAIVRHIVEMHGGSISVESPGFGGGATFTALLPLSRGRVEEGGGPELPSDDGRLSLEQVRVLVVDDDADARDLLRTVFSRAGAEVALASSVAEAMDMMHRVQPDVLISDIGMPDEDGYELIRRVRASGSAGAALPAVALSAYVGADHRRRALEAGYQAHVPKPVSIAQIVALVVQLVNGSRGHARG
jgi:PAS domain S-box-containing protein